MRTLRNLLIVTLLATLFCPGGAFAAPRLFGRAVARAHGEWLVLDDAGGKRLDPRANVPSTISSEVDLSCISFGTGDIVD